MKKIKQEYREEEYKFRLLTGLNLIEYEILYEKFAILIERKLFMYTLKGKLRNRVLYKESPNSLMGSSSKLDFILMYLKENPNQQYHAYLFSMCQSKVSEWVSFILPVLEESLISLSVMPQSGYEYCQKTNEDIIVDVTERIVPRRTDHESQKEEYSGKKKIHSIKNLAITNTDGFVNFISNYYFGTTHDKSIWDDLTFKFKNCTLYADLGFKGIYNSNLTIVVPHKKPRKSDLTEEQKNENKEISSKRIIIEHSFGKIKIFKMIRDKIRLKCYDVRDTVFKISAALHNLRIISKGHVINKT